VYDRNTEQDLKLEEEDESVSLRVSALLNGLQPI